MITGQWYKCKGVKGIYRFYKKDGMRYVFDAWKDNESKMKYVIIYTDKITDFEPININDYENNT